MTEHADALHLAHISEIAARIERSALGPGREVFIEDEEPQDATIYRLQTLAESTQRLLIGIKEAHPGIPWADIAGLRSRLVHGYLGIDINVIWDVVERDLPSLAEVARVELALHRSRREPERD